MNADTTSPTHTLGRLFVGTHLDTGLRIALNQSQLWKQATILPATNGQELIEIRHHGKDYVGCYLTLDKVPLSKVQETERFIKQRLQDYCPTSTTDNIKVCVFAQLFVA